VKDTEGKRIHIIIFYKTNSCTKQSSTMKPGLIWLELKQAISGIIFNDDGREAGAGTHQNIKMLILYRPKHTTAK
jgi:hypothetical protein